MGVSFMKLRFFKCMFYNARTEIPSFKGMKLTPHEFILML